MESLFSDGINWWAVIVATVAYFFLGALWYSKLLFVESWLHYTKIDIKDPNASKGIAAIMIASFVFTFIICLGLAILRDHLGISGWWSGIKLGLLTGAFFGATALSISYLYEQKPAALHAINNGYTIAGHVLAAVIICSWL